MEAMDCSYHCLGTDAERRWAWIRCLEGLMKILWSLLI